MNKKLGFALGAGGSRGVAHVGFLQAMDEEGIKPDFITGTSMGAVVGACYAKGFSPKFIMQEIGTLSLVDLLDLSFSPLTNAALLRAQKMRKKLSEYIEEQMTFDELQIPFRCVAVDLLSGNPVVFKDGDKVCEAITASSTIPGVFKPVAKDDMLLVDGGVKCRLPIDPVREMGSDIIVAVDVMGKIRPVDKKFNVFSLMFRTYDIMDEEITYRKLQEQKPDFLVTPDLGDMDLFRFKDIDMAYEKGYEIGKKYAPEILTALSSKNK